MQFRSSRHVTAVAKLLKPEENRYLRHSFVHRFLNGLKSLELQHMSKDFGHGPCLSSVLSTQCTVPLVAIGD